MRAKQLILLLFCIALQTAITSSTSLQSFTAHDVSEAVSPTPDGSMRLLSIPSATATDKPLLTPVDSNVWELNVGISVFLPSTDYIDFRLAFSSDAGAIPFTPEGPNCPSDDPTTGFSWCYDAPTATSKMRSQFDSGSWDASIKLQLSQPQSAAALAAWSVTYTLSLRSTSEVLLTNTLSTPGAHPIFAYEPHASLFPVLAPAGGAGEFAIADLSLPSPFGASAGAAADNVITIRSTTLTVKFPTSPSSASCFVDISTSVNAPWPRSSDHRWSAPEAFDSVTGQVALPLPPALNLADIRSIFLSCKTALSDESVGYFPSAVSYTAGIVGVPIAQYDLDTLPDPKDSPMGYLDLIVALEEPCDFLKDSPSDSLFPPGVFDGSDNRAPDDGNLDYFGAVEWNKDSRVDGRVALSVRPIGSLTRAHYMAGTFFTRLATLGPDAHIQFNIRPDRLDPFWGRLGYLSVPLIRTDTGEVEYPRNCVPGSADIPQAFFRSCIIPPALPHFPNYVGTVATSGACSGGPDVFTSDESGCIPMFVHPSIAAQTDGTTVTITVEATYEKSGNWFVARPYSAVILFDTKLLKGLSTEDIACTVTRGTDTAACFSQSISQDGAQLTALYRLLSEGPPPKFTISFKPRFSTSRHATVTFANITSAQHGSHLLTTAETAIQSRFNYRDLSSEADVSFFRVRNDKVVAFATLDSFGHDFDTFSFSVTEGAGETPLECSQAYSYGTTASSAAFLREYKVEGDLDHPELYSLGHAVSHTSAGDFVKMYPTFAFVCSIPSTLTEPSLSLNVVTSSVWTRLASNAQQKPPLEPFLCTRVGVTLTAPQVGSESHEASAASSFTLALGSRFSDLLSAVDHDNGIWFSTPTGHAMRVCSKRTATDIDGSAEAAVDSQIANSVVSSFFTHNSSLNHFFGSFFPATMEEHLGSITGISYYDPISASWPAWGFKCLHSHDATAPAALEYCIAPRCVPQDSSTGEYAASMPPTCYFQSSVVSEAECLGSNKPVIETPADCDVPLVDVSVLSTSTDGAILEVAVQAVFDGQVDATALDFPLLQVVFGSFSAEGSLEVSQVRVQDSFENAASAVIIDSSVVAHAASGTTIDISSTPSKVFIVTFTHTDPATVVDHNIVYQSRISVTTAPTLPGADVHVFVDSAALPKGLLYTTMLAEPVGNDVELFGRFPSLSPWMRRVLSTPSSGSSAVMHLHVAAGDWSSLKCRTSALPTVATIADELASHTTPRMLPWQWDMESTAISDGDYTIVQIELPASVVENEVPYAIYCTATGVTSTESDCKITYALGAPGNGTPRQSLMQIRHDSTGPVGPNHIATFNASGDIDVAHVASKLAESFADGPDAIVAIGSRFDIEGVPARAIAPNSVPAIAMRCPSLLSALLPSADLLHAAASFLTSDMGAESGATTKLEEVYAPLPSGEYKCGTDAEACVAPDSACSESYTKPIVCATIDGNAVPEADHLFGVSCAFADKTALPPLPVTSGCGELLCTLPSGAFGSCSDASVCTEGCDMDISLTDEVIAGSSSLTPVCVKGGSSVTAELCPSSLVSEPVYAPTCNATSTCGTVCTTADGFVVECASEDSWSECSDPCQGGIATRFVRCADTSISAGTESGAAMPIELCPGGKLDTPLEKTCAGDEAMCANVPTVLVQSVADSGAEYTITWDDASGDASIPGVTALALEARDVKGLAAGTVVSLGSVSTDLFAKTFSVFEENIAFGTYVATAFPEGARKGVSAEFTIVPPCTVVPCQNQGVCDSDTGMCACKGDFSGDACQVSPCDVSLCSKETGTCSVGSAHTAVCKCLGFWSGPNCDISPCDFVTCDPTGSTGACVPTAEGFPRCPCAADADGKPLYVDADCALPANYCEIDGFPCQNGGIRQGDYLSNGIYGCTECLCPGEWSVESDCADCSRACAHGTSHDDTCTSCMCPADGGYSGERCECRDVHMSFVVKHADAPEAKIFAAYKAAYGAEAAATAGFLDQLATLFGANFAAATGIPRVQSAQPATAHTSPAGTKYYSIPFSVGSACGGPVMNVTDVSDADMVPTYAAIAAVKKFFNSSSHIAPNFPALSALHSPAGFSAVDVNCRLPGDECPSGWAGAGVFADDADALACDGADANREECSHRPEEKKSGSDDLSTGAIVGIAVGGSVALVLLLLLLCYLTGVCCFTNKARTQAVEMTSV